MEGNRPVVRERVDYVNSSLLFRVILLSSNFCLSSKNYLKLTPVLKPKLLVENTNVSLPWETIISFRGFLFGSEEFTQHVYN